MVNAPIATEVGGGFLVATGYCESLKTYSQGELPPNVPLDEAVAMLIEALSDFDFATPSDHSRAIAAFISPAMLFGGFVSDNRVPIDYAEADDSQSGKGYRQQMVVAAYKEIAGSVTQTAKKGVGSLEEAFDSKVIEGRSFIQLENMRGEIDCTKIESFLTEPSYTARAPFKPQVTVDPTRRYVLLTTNGSQLKVDLANRSSFVRIRKRPADYKYKAFPGGRDILGHVKANQTQYLGAIHAIVREWHRRGKPSNSGQGHDFRKWAGIMDWIVQEIFGLAPLLDGHRNIQRRTTSKHAGWLRRVAIEVKRAGRLDEPLRCHQIFQLLEDTDVEIPGYDPTGESQERAFRAIGSRISRAIKSIGGGNEPCCGPSCGVDEFIVSRSDLADDGHRFVAHYVFTESAPNSSTPQQAPERAPQPTPQQKHANPQHPEGAAIRADGGDGSGGLVRASPPPDSGDLPAGESPYGDRVRVVRGNCGFGAPIFPEEGCTQEDVSTVSQVDEVEDIRMISDDEVAI